MRTFNPLLDLDIFDLPAYMPGYEIGESLMDPLIAFAQQPGYATALRVTPQVYLLPIPALGVTEDTIRVKPGSYLTMLSFGSAQAAGFKFELFDMGAQEYILPPTSSVALKPAAGQPPQFILPKPYCVLAPGRIQVILTNLANATNDMQLLMFFAEPSPEALDAIVI